VIHETDAVTLLQSLPDDSTQLIWTDPPFGTNNKQTIVSTGKHYQDRNQAEAITLVADVLKESKRILTASGVIAICLDYRIVHQVFCKAIEIGLLPQGEIIWTFGLGRGASNWWANKHNTILLFSKTDKPLFKPDAVPMIQRKWPKKGYEGAKKVASVWDITLSNTHPERVGYPNQKPLALIQPFIKAHTNEQDLVVDPFGGSGSTAQAAKLLNRRWETCDTNNTAVETMKERLI
jgi:site-specific DNA-methyltransferase (adenine-specific)